MKADWSKENLMKIISESKTQKKTERHNRRCLKV
jgi:hypothetical protein